ncbi:MAG: Hpt domain-containing protein, partial [Granulosicoccus sp.]|nr:Hpt domain-containing protein [Granulosicoccus sp.]
VIKPGSADSLSSENIPLESTLSTKNAHYAELAASFTARLGGKLREIDEAWSRRDHHELAKLAHWLRGAGGTVGFDSFTHPATRLESAAIAQDDMMCVSSIREVFQIAGRIAGVGEIPSLLHDDKFRENDENCEVQQCIKEPANTLQCSSIETIPIVSRLAGNAKMHGLIVDFLGSLADKEAAMQQAWKDQDYEELETLARWLKGSAGTFGFDVFTEPASELESAIPTRSVDVISTQLEYIRDLSRRAQCSASDADNCSMSDVTQLSGG